MSKKILVVDDEPVIVKVVKSRLEANDYEVITAYNGEEALEKTEREMPDLIILDILMPNMNGYEFAKRVETNKSTKHIPIIVLTAKDKIPNLFEIEGIKDHILKPFKAEDLLRRVEKYLTPETEKMADNKIET